MPVLVKRGHRGRHVADIQTRLNLERIVGYSVYPPLVEDGIYGTNTKTRVEEYQGLNPPLKVDGVVGPNTWSRLFAGVTGPVATGPTKTGPAPSATPVKRDPPRPAVLYVHAHDAPGKNTAGSIHHGQEVHHIEVPNGKAADAPAMMKALIERENIVLSALVINTHGGGAGRIKIGGIFVHLGEQPGFFKAVKDHLAPGAIVWIYACAFAVSSVPKGDLDAWLVTPGEMLHGEGIKALQTIARYLQRETRAGFGMQYGDMSGFAGTWVSADAAGRYTFHLFGRRMSAREYVDTFKSVIDLSVSEAKAELDAAEAKIAHWLFGR